MGTGEHVKENLAAHALGALPDDEARAVDQHLAQCDSCRSEFEAALETAAMLAFSTNDVAPSEQLRARVLDAAKATPQLSQPSVRGLAESTRERARVYPIRRGWRVEVFGAIAASLALVALFLSIFLWQRDRRLQTQLSALAEQSEQQSRELNRLRDENEILTSPSARTATLSGTPAASTAKAKLVFDQSSGKAILVANNLPAAPAGKAYQLWFIADGKPIPGKTFRPDQVGAAVVTDQIPGSATQADWFALQLEPEQGCHNPHV